MNKIVIVNKGHAAGYCIISMEEMYYKVYYPTYFWYVKIKYARNDKEKDEFCCQATKDGSVVFLPHVNYSKPTVSILFFTLSISSVASLPSISKFSALKNRTSPIP